MDLNTLSNIRHIDLPNNPGNKKTHQHCIIRGQGKISQLKGQDNPF